MKHASQIFATLTTHVPATTRDYCFQLWEQNPFELKLTKTRQTKVGDFSSGPHRAHRITLNHDLNPYLFLITYIHEVAHLHVHLRYKRRVEPHGTEWKKTFQQLMEPVLWENVFPEKILHAIRLHMVDPKASSYADTELTEALRAYDTNAAQQIVVGTLPEGTIFKLQGKYFQKGKLRRTRILCREMKSKRDYLVPVDALVTDVQLSLL